RRADITIIVHADVTTASGSGASPGTARAGGAEFSAAGGAWEARPVLDVRPLTATIGAEIYGADLRAGLPDADRDVIREALLRHLVVFFRDQDLTEGEQLAVAAGLGEPVSAGVDPTATEPLLFVTLEDTAADPPKADRWHT